MNSTVKALTEAGRMAWADEYGVARVNVGDHGATASVMRDGTMWRIDVDGNGGAYGPWRVHAWRDALTILDVLADTAGPSL